MNRLNLKPYESLFTTQKGDALILNKETSEWRGVNGGLKLSNYGGIKLST